MARVGSMKLAWGQRFDVLLTPDLVLSFFMEA